MALVGFILTFAGVVLLVFGLFWLISAAVDRSNDDLEPQEWVALFAVLSGIIWGGLMVLWLGVLMVLA